MRILPAILVLSAAMTCISTAQTSPTTRDQLAIQWLQASMKVLGANGLQPGFQSVVLSGLEEIAAGDRSRTHAFSLKASSTEYRIEGDRGARTRTFVSGHGHPAEERNGKTTQIPYHVARANVPLLLPSLVLSRELNDPKYSIVLKGTEGSVNPLIHIQVTDNSDQVGRIVTVQDWYIDATTALPARVEYRIPSVIDATRYSNVTLVYSTFQKTKGLLFPATATNKLGSLAVTYQITSVATDSGVADSDFDLHAGGAQ